MADESSFRFESGLQIEGPAENPRKKTTGSHNWVVKLQIFFMFIPKKGKWSDLTFAYFSKWVETLDKVEMIFLFTVWCFLGFFLHFWWPTWFLVDQQSFLCLYGEVPLSINPWNIDVFLVAVNSGLGILHMQLLPIHSDTCCEVKFVVRVYPSICWGILSSQCFFSIAFGRLQGPSFGGFKVTPT